MLQSQVSALVAQRTRLSKQESGGGGGEDTEGLPWGAGGGVKGFKGALCWDGPMDIQGPALKDPAVQLKTGSSASIHKATAVLPKVGCPA